MEIVDYKMNKKENEEEEGKDEYGYVRLFECCRTGEGFYCLKVRREGIFCFFGIVSMCFLRFYLLFKIRPIQCQMPFGLNDWDFTKKSAISNFYEFYIVCNAGFELLRIQSVDE